MSCPTRSEDPAPYPGSGASPQEITRFAQAYHSSALLLIEAGRGREAVDRAPGRYCALHAIELYLHAFLREAGEAPARLRAHPHNFGMHAALAMERGLVLRRKTALHLAQLSSKRDYLVVRYGPDCMDAVCELNRLVASLEEIARKVRAAIVPGGGTGEAAA
jgi:hypothetical protein